MRSALPGCHIPPHVVCFGQGVDPEVAVSFLRLLDDGDGVAEELVESAAGYVTRRDHAAQLIMGSLIACDR